jgi:hypothetical protein
MGGVVSSLQTLGDTLNTAEPKYDTLKKVFTGIIFVASFIILLLFYIGIIQKASSGGESCSAMTRLLENSVGFAKANYARAEGFADMGLEGRKSLYRSLINSLEPGERFLVNLCPLTASIGGYIGTQDPGVFHSEFYVQNALRAGVRSFVLPISVYIDDNKFPPKWPLSGMPAIVCRNTAGKILSANGLSVKDFCNHVMTYMNENPDQADEPIIIYIHETENYVPNPITQEKKYVKLMSQIARELDVIPQERRLIVLGSYGSAVRSANESVILTQIPLTELKSKFIIMTNFDTKIALKSAYDNINPKLMDYTNFTIKPVIAQNAGLNVCAGNASRSLKLEDVSGSKINWTDQARTVWHATTQDDPLVMPSEKLVMTATRSGIQMIPIPIFMTKDVTTVKNVWKNWDGYAWRVKEKDARYLKPAPVEPQAPSARMNARVSPGSQPGQVAVL